MKHPHRIDVVTLWHKRLQSHVLAQIEDGDDTGRSDVWCVRHDSPKRERAAVEQYAKYFRREFQYDFVQYSADEEPLADRAFLFVPDPWGWGQRTVGACCFRRREDSGGSWFALAWIWLHPYWRSRGLLSNAWSYFVHRFAPFRVEPPLSPAMQGFLRRKGVRGPAWEVTRRARRRSAAR
jgi:hypothetical protein